jgi:hypothetical protein
MRQTRPGSTSTTTLPTTLTPPTMVIMPGMSGTPLVRLTRRPAPRPRSRPHSTDVPDTAAAVPAGPPSICGPCRRLN